MVLIALLFVASLVPPQEDGRVPVPVPEPAAAPVRGVVVDPGTGRPVPHLRIELTGADRTREELVTDADGAFASTAAFPPGRTFLQAAENVTPRTAFAGAMVRFEHEGTDGGEPRRLELPVGPRLELEVALPEGATLEDYEVRATRAGGLERSAHYDWEGAAELRAPIEPGGRPWVRFSGSRHGRTFGRDVLWLLGRDGLSGARAELTPEQVAGVEDAPPVVLRPRPLGAVVVRLGGAYGGPDFEALPRVHLDPVESAAGGDGRLPLEEGVHGDACRIAWVEPGEWTAAVTSPYAEGARAAVRVLPGAEVALDLALGEPRPRGTVLVRVVRAEGDFEAWERFGDAPAVNVDLWPHAADGRPFSAVVTALCGVGIDTHFERVARDGRTVLEATFEDVPEGTYDLHGWGGEDLLVPSWIVVRPGDEVTLTLRDRDEDGADRYGFRLVPPEGVERRPFTRLLPVARTGAFPLVGAGYFDDFEWIAARELPPDDPVRWCLVADGYERVYGDRGDFALEPDGAYRAEVHLVPGWSLRLVARGEHGAPLAGVPVELGGVPQGWTDAAGVLLLRAPEAARDPRVAFPGWKPTGGDVGPDGRFRDARAELHVVLAREP